MLTRIAVHPEGARYARSLVFVPGLWTTAEAWRRLASFLAHRGWAGLILDWGGREGLEERSRGLAAVVGEVEPAPVVIGHDAGGIVALAAAHQAAAGAVVWLAPFGPRPRELVRTLGPWRLARAMVLGTDVPRPVGPAALALWGASEPGGLREAEAVRFVRDAIRGPMPPAPAPPPPIALVAGEHDLVAAAARRPAAERIVVPGAGRWLLGGDAWQPAARVVHRWLVQRLGAENLELYEEAMAEREDVEED